MLHFDINLDSLKQVSADLGASEKQFKAAFGRACARTAATLRKMSSKGLKDELQLRSISVLRKRLKSMRLRGSKDGDVQIWYGLNDLPVSAFKGRVKQDTGGAWAGEFYHEGGFVRKSKYGRQRNTIFKRKGKGRLPVAEQLQAIKDQAMIYIEDRIFLEVDRIFWGHFVRDLEARVKYDIRSERWR